MSTNVIKKSKIYFNGKMGNIALDILRAFWHITLLVEGEVVMVATPPSLIPTVKWKQGQYR